MPWLYYETATGSLTGWTTADVPSNPPAWTAVEITGQQVAGLSDASLMWDPVTHALVPRPVPVEIVVSQNVRTKARNAIANNTAALAAQATMLANLNALATVTVANTAAAQTAIRALAVEVRKLANNADDRIHQDTGIIRLLLGDFYGDTSVLQTEDGT